ncbi:hypothetical protein BaRGS_00000997 [Batillaria attramentaria]|uniref:Uncharacterized protein n=1 Tax=Batillaria attramentaria TaxID=370345 RepID=A0ABD0M9H3_9CAEN
MASNLGQSDYGRSCQFSLPPQKSRTPVTDMTGAPSVSLQTRKRQTTPFSSNIDSISYRAQKLRRLHLPLSTRKRDLEDEILRKAQHSNPLYVQQIVFSSVV